ncbi:hypothetical protein ANRL1_02743 [Anaerolineae bacterium]|nr:hypothetical protein ANRL1_02743 [Anaerolineae bacterium]
MNPEVLLKLSHIAIAAGLIIAALGGYGVYHFKRLIENGDKNRQEYRLSEIDSKLDEIITQNQLISETQKQEIIRTLKQAEKGQLENLKNKYSLGYALLYIDKESWYFIPRNIELNVNWFSTKIISQSKGQITILLPDFNDKRQNRFIGNTVSIPRVVGSSISPFLIGTIKVVTECLDTTDEGTTIVVGFQNLKD